MTRPDRPKGRQLHPSPPPIKDYLMHAYPKIPLFQPQKVSTPECADVLKRFNPDFFLVAAYGEIIKQAILDIPRIGCINVHASLLPKYRGAAPIQRCLMAGDPISGVTLISMTAQMDAGDILAKEEIPIDDEMTAGELEKKLSELGAHLILDVFEKCAQHQITRIAQDHSQATLAPKLTPEEEIIHWDQPAHTIHNLIRALSPKPGAWAPVYLNGEKKRLKILRSKWMDSSSGELPGAMILFKEGRWLVACGQGVLELLDVQLEGKKRLSSKEFIKGMNRPLSFLS